MLQLTEHFLTLHLPVLHLLYRYLLLLQLDLLVQRVQLLQFHLLVIRKLCHTLLVNRLNFIAYRADPLSFCDFFPESRWMIFHTNAIRGSHKVSFVAPSLPHVNKSCGLNRLINLRLLLLLIDYLRRSQRQLLTYSIDVIINVVRLLVILLLHRLGILDRWCIIVNIVIGLLWQILLGWLLLLILLLFLLPTWCPRPLS